MKKIKRYLCIAFLLSAALPLAGCNTRELEDRSFPLAIGIDETGSGCSVAFYFPQLSEIADEKAKSDEGESFRVVADSYYEAWQTYEADSENSLDYNHLKVLVFGMDFLENENALEQFLEFAVSQENFARNTLVFVASPDASDILSLNGGLNEPVGTFLEDMVTGSTVYKTHAMPTLGDLYNEYYNRNSVLFLPVLSENGGIPAILEFYVFRDFKPVGTLDMQDALVGLLAENKLRSFSVKLSGGEIIKLDAPDCSYEITTYRGKPQLILTVKSEVALMNGMCADSEKREELEAQTNRKLTEVLKETLCAAQDEKGVDLADSFRKLGGSNRSLYDRYAGDKTHYDAVINYEVKSEVTLVDTK
mgnify:FL=1